MSEEKYFSTIDEFIKETPAKKMIAHAFKEIAPNKDNLCAFAISLVLGIFFAYIVGFNENTVKMLLAIVGILLNILVGVFGYLFTVYSILLAFLGDSYIKELSKINGCDGISYLKSSTTYYESVLFLYFIGLAITGVLSLFLNCIENDWVLTPNLIVNNGLAILLLSLYFSFIFRIIYELKSTIYNTIVLFRQSIAYKILIIVKKEKEGINSDNNNK